MKNVCFALFGCSVLLLLISVYSKLTDNEVMDFDSISWWRMSLATVLHLIALVMITRGNHGSA